MSWTFAIINGRLAEIFFDTDSKNLKIYGHCYVSKSEYKTKREQRMIEKDIKRFQFSYRNKKYRDKFTKKVLRMSTLLQRKRGLKAKP